MQALVSVDSQSLQLSLVLTEVEHCLGNDNITVNLSVQIGKGRPLSSTLNLHRVKHESSLGHFLDVGNIVETHLVEGLLLLFLEVGELGLGVH